MRVVVLQLFCTRSPNSVMRILLSAIIPLGLLLVAACEIDPLTSSGGHPPVQSVRLLGPDGTVISSPPVLPRGEPTQVRVQFLNPNGEPLPDLDDSHTVDLFWAPESFTHMERVEGQPLARNLTVLAAPCSTGQLSIGYGHHGQSNEKVFGPFPVRVAPEVTELRLFDDGREITPKIVWPAKPTLKVEARLIDCNGKRVSGPEHTVEFYWAPDNFAHVAAVPDRPLTREVTVLVPPCSNGKLSVGYLKSGKLARVFGPYDVAVGAGPASAKLFLQDGTELTPNVRLPARQRTAVQVQFFDCDRQRVAEPLTAAEMNFYWSPDQFAHVEAVPNQPAVREVVPLVPAGSEGFLSVGLQYGGSERIFGPFPVSVQ